jgi:indole-3-glycerol phosphate synthase
VKPRETGTILDRIVARKAERLAASKVSMPLEAVVKAAADAPAPRNFRSAIRRSAGINLIAEVKKASPSRGVLREQLDPTELARHYESAGASAISLITEEDFFLGSPAYIGEVRESVALPVLRKDFIFDPYQVYESRALGADAMLIIAAILEKDAASELVGLAGRLGMAALVEIHDESELELALNCGAEVIGINNRNLKTMEVDVGTAVRLAPLVPDGIMTVAESGISSREDVEMFDRLGLDAILVGEAIVVEDDVEAKIRLLLGKPD